MISVIRSNVLVIDTFSFLLRGVACAMPLSKLGKGPRCVIALNIACSTAHEILDAHNSFTFKEFCCTNLRKLSFFSSCGGDSRLEAALKSAGFPFPLCASSHHFEAMSLVSAHYLRELGLEDRRTPGA